MPTQEQAVQYFEEGQGWMLTTDHTAYALGVRQDGGLQHLYWGERLPYPADYPGFGRPRPRPPGIEYSVEARELKEQGALAVEEYPAWGGLLFTEPCLKVTFADGVRDLALVYRDYRLEHDSAGLVIGLEDSVYPLRVELHYRVIPECDLIDRWTVIRNTGNTPVDIEAALSACWHLPALTGGSFRLTHLSGRWNADTQVRRVMLPEGRTTLESRRGTTSAEANPFFALDIWQNESGGAGEEQGQVWFGALGWSGNWKIALEQASHPLRVSVSGGLNDFDFRWRLRPGEEFATPHFVGGYTGQGFGQASRNLHRYQLDYLLPRQHARQSRRVLYNSWEAVFFDVTEQKQMQLAERAARLGVELFVVDDGWFGERHHDRAGLGDWYVNRQKFPNGLGPLVQRVNDLGMDFGLWVEPEMVNADSDLYRAHPDWVFHFPTRPRTEFRYQLMLNLSRPEVGQYLFERLDRLLSDHNITFVKWDFNRPLTEPGWPDAPPEHQREVYVRHVQGLYNLVDRLRAGHPQVVWESCASGGGRVDLGALSHFDQTWPSDNTDPYDRLLIQEGYSLAYAPKTMMAWATHSPSSEHINNVALSLRYRFHSAMTGALGLGEDLNRYSETQMEEVAALVREYKEIRPLVQEGQLYRLVSPRSGPLAAVQYASRDRRQAVVFVFHHLQHYWQPAPRVRLQGLDPARLYTLAGDVGETGPVSGQSLMSLGVLPRLSGHLASALIRLNPA